MYRNWLLFYNNKAFEERKKTIPFTMTSNTQISINLAKGSERCTMKAARL